MTRLHCAVGLGIKPTYSQIIQNCQVPTVGVEYLIRFVVVPKVLKLLSLVELENFGFSWHVEKVKKKKRFCKKCCFGISTQF